MKPQNPLRKLRLKKHQIDEALLKQARRERSIVFGGQAIKRKLGINARRPEDFDMFTDKPKSSAIKAEGNLDRLFRRDVFFTKRGANPTTYKVKHKGKDLKPRTDDDVGIVDFTKTPKPKPRTFTFRGVQYRILSEELKAKQRLVKNKEFEFRKAKDLEDLRRIIKFGNLK